MTATHSIRIARDRHFGWTAKTRIGIDTKRMLLVETRKLETDLVTEARVYQDGVTKLTLGGHDRDWGDFSERVISAPASRVTRVMVQTQHEKALAKIADVLARAADYYKPD